MRERIQNLDHFKELPSREDCTPSLQQSRCKTSQKPSQSFPKGFSWQLSSYSPLLFLWSLGAKRSLLLPNGPPYYLRTLMWDRIFNLFGGKKRITWEDFEFLSQKISALCVVGCFLHFIKLLHQYLVVSSLLVDTYQRFPSISFQAWKLYFNGRPSTPSLV